MPECAPPTFLVCADDDRWHVVTTVNLYPDLEKQGVSSEMHIYASGGHGFGIRPSARPVSQWTERLEQWMAERKLGGGASRGNPVAGRGLRGQLERAWWCASPFQRGAEDV